MVHLGNRQPDRSDIISMELTVMRDCSVTLMLRPIFSPSSLTICWIPLARRPPGVGGKNPTIFDFGQYQASLDISFFFLLVSLSYHQGWKRGVPPPSEMSHCLLNPFRAASMTSVLKLSSYPESLSLRIAPSVVEAFLTWLGRAESLYYLRWVSCRICE